ncbi:MAG: hypothetical protein ACI9JN_001711 [Bacteroidia bacterium]
MKKIIAIVVLFNLLSSFTGIQFCIDYCGNTIESIHFGEDEPAACHTDACCFSEVQDCCDSDQIQIEAQHLDFTMSSLPMTHMPVVFIKRSRHHTESVAVQTGNKLSYQLYSKSLPSTSVRALTQVTLC